MHNRALHDSLAAFVEEAARQLADEVSGGAEVPFELMEMSPHARAASPLYCYRPLTGRFIGERIGVLARLPSYPAAAHGLGALPDLPAYLQARGRRTPGPDRRSQADAALQAFLTAVWTDATEFTFDPTRFAQAFTELEVTAYDGCTLSVVLAPVDGLVIESEELALGEGLALVRAGTLTDAPGDIGHDETATVALLALEGAPGDHRALEDAGRRLRRLQTALRLWDDAEPALGPTAWARTDGSAWWAVPLATGFRRPKGDCLLEAEEEDALRAFCSLVSRRTPRAGAVEALTDWLLAARALLAEPGQPGYDGVAERMAAICAPPEERARAEGRIRDAIALERAAVAGLVRPEPDVDELISELGASLRAMLRDVLCGHLDPALRRVADELMADEPEPVDTLH